MIVSIEGHTPDVSSAAFVADNATVCGDVKVGENSSIWFGAVLRAECEPLRIGDRTNVQDNVVVHIDSGFPVTIGSDVTVGHGAIGMGSTILNGAVIGEGSVVAAGALVLEGAVVPPYSLVAGVPAKVKKALSAEEVKNRIDYYTPRYVREAKLYAGSN